MAGLPRDRFWGRSCRSDETGCLDDRGKEVFHGTGRDVKGVAAITRNINRTAPDQVKTCELLCSCSREPIS
jgi:hypothetical protein